MTTTMSPIEAGALRLLAQEIMEREGIPGSAPPWSSLARVAQLPPDGDWATWLYLEVVAQERPAPGRNG